MRIPPWPGHRRAVAGVVAALFIFLMLFTAGVGLLLFQNQTNLAKYQADSQAIGARGLASLEGLSMIATLNSTNNHLVVAMNNTGGTPETVVAAFVKDATGAITSPIMAFGAPGDTSAPSAVTLNIAAVGTAQLLKYTYSLPPGTPVFVNVMTSRGNIFSTRYPLSVPGNSTTSLMTTTVSTTSTLGAVGNPLVVVMQASPPQAFTGQTLTLNITFYNFSPTPLTSPQLNPPTPQVFTTGTAKLTLNACTGPSPSGTISGYSGSGTPPHIYFLCTYAVSQGPLGGVASFQGAGTAVLNGTTVYSAWATSNIVQIGGLTNVLVYGAFTVNFFVFKFTSCANSPKTQFASNDSFYYPVSYGSPCNSNPGTIPPPGGLSSLPTPAAVKSQNYFYVAFYLQVTNNFNTTLTIEPYTMMQIDQSDGGESDWWLAGDANHLTNGTYYPNYSPGASGTHLPQLVPYPNPCNSACFALGPGQSQVLTLAACGYGSRGWDWGGVGQGAHFDSYYYDYGGGCVSSWPNIGTTGQGSATVTTLVIAFLYNGKIYTQDIQFMGVAFVP